ncbi:MAG: phosphoribosylformylglycinamidine synthase subunit PurL [Candidatus Dadabacteria bacterium]|nr:phosphoribosylformylglycinamidine synthase subunit PurL [Candidatus Dadabacteria bacterium]MDE0663703.1 phosphoribosylformylglycinamidine synthase subunit PurL [Candidatus Dadabacteria bacterium]
MNKAPLKFALDHGLTESEYQKIIETLGREPNSTEIGILGAMWSEHCSYKSSKVHLRKFPTTGEQVIQGPGENAGVVDIGDGDCVVFKMESHNHPSFIEPYQGAATGVGGILRDIFTMGARPVALLNSLRFGNPDLQKTKFLVEGVVSGIAGYGNCMGIPTVGGEIYFDDCYNGNPLVNAFALGVTKEDNIFRGYASGEGNPVIYVGSKTGRDGIQGAIMASDTFTEETEEKRPAVQVGDPFTEKLLLEACLELFKTDCVVGIQDMGAAGLTSSSTEMADRAGTGLEIQIDRVPRREEGMTPYEVMLSESQERMLVVLEKGKENTARDIFRKWNLDFSIIGKVTDSGRLTIVEEGSTVADLPVSLITSGAPTYERPVKRPAYLNKIKKLDSEDIPEPEDIERTFLEILSSPTVSSKKWVYEQYDHMVRTDTVLGPGADSAIIRLKGTHKGIAMTSNVNSRYCYLSPREGTKIAVAESVRNLACCGASPLAITDCLNFGNPENSEIMWQFQESVEGMSEAARTFNTPVVSGNVSLYNETEGVAIFPTPTVAMVGLIEDIAKTVTSWFQDPGDLVILLGGAIEEDIGGSEYLNIQHGLIDGKPPSIDLDKEKKLAEMLIACASQSILKSAHDISEGGFTVALAECCFSPDGTRGVLVKAPDINENSLRGDLFLFSETQSRVIASISEANWGRIEEMASNYGVPALRAGVVIDNDRFCVEDLIDMKISAVHDAWSMGFQRSLSVPEG